jgi:hypothetical protein
MIVQIAVEDSRSDAQEDDLQGFDGGFHEVDG